MKRDQGVWNGLGRVENAQGDWKVPRTETVESRVQTDQ